MGATEQKSDTTCEQVCGSVIVRYLHACSSYLLLHQSGVQGTREPSCAPATIHLYLPRRVSAIIIHPVRHRRLRRCLAGCIAFRKNLQRTYIGGTTTPLYMVVGQENPVFCSTLHNKPVLYFFFSIIFNNFIFHFVFYLLFLFFI